MNRTCVHCGSQFEGRSSQRFCPALPGQNMSACAVAHNSASRPRRDRSEYNRRYREGVAADAARAEAAREYRRAWVAENLDRCRAHAAKYAAANPDKVAARHAAYKRSEAYRSRLVSRASTPLAGSVVAAASHRAPGRDLLVELLGLVSGNDPSYREEVVATAALLVLEGRDPQSAVVEAARQVRRAEAPGRYAVQVESCMWL